MHGQARFYVVLGSTLPLNYISKSLPSGLKSPSRLLSPVCPLFVFIRQPTGSILLGVSQPLASKLQEDRAVPLFVLVPE